jgi:hypothetical protein
MLCFHARDLAYRTESRVDKALFRFSRLLKSFTSSSLDVSPASCCKSTIPACPGYDQSRAAAGDFQEIQAGSGSKPSTIRCAACRKIASVITSAGAAGADLHTTDIPLQDIIESTMGAAFVIDVV